MSYPPYSLDIVSYGLVLFLQMKSHLQITHHGGIEEVKEEAVIVMLNGLSSDDYQGWFETKPDDFFLPFFKNT